MATAILRIGTLFTLVVTLTACNWLGISVSERQGPGGPPGQRNTAVAVSVGIGRTEARGLAVKHGITGLRSLPPGIQRNLARGKPLPPGIARQMVPGRMLAELPGIPDHEWRISGRDLVLIAIGTLIVVEILEDVFE